MGTLWETCGNMFFVPSLERYVASYRMDETRYEVNLTPTPYFSRESNSMFARYDRWQHVLAVEVNFDYRIQRSTGPGVKMKGSQNNTRTATKSKLSGASQDISHTVIRHPYASKNVGGVLISTLL
jgi:hypothetical protein